MKRIKIIFSTLSISWLFIITIFSYINYSQIDTATKENILTTVRTNLQEIIVFRHWIAGFGGVYVKVKSDGLQPSKYLNRIKHRDIVSTTGDKFTLVNPAWMTRQIFELENKKYKSQKDIVSSDYLNPMNKPDNWQQSTLDKFEKDKDLEEYYQFSDETLKYMLPLVTKSKCVVCHPTYKNQIGEIRGAISFYLDLTPYNNSQDSSVFSLFINFFIIFILGLIVLFILYRIQIKDYLKHEELEKENLKHQKEILEARKMVQMGEMIGNIAHQWRQPLNAISVSASGMILMNEVDILSKEKSNKMLGGIVKSTNYLSKTIDTFRDYIKEDQVLQDVILQDRITYALNIFTSTLSNTDIKVINNINDVDDIHINIVVGELSQVLINILNNAKDVLEENNIRDKSITISLKKEDYKITIIIDDNGGGISENIIDKVFDPYFTTKHKSQGTGLGLHMSKDIIENHLNGKLYIENIEDGARFCIELPLSK